MDLDDVGGYDRPYNEYELSRADRESLRQINKCLDDGSCSIQDLRDLLDYAEDLQKRVREVIRNEESTGYSNETLKHDFKKISEVTRRLAQELDRKDA